MPSTKRGDGITIGLVAAMVCGSWGLLCGCGGSSATSPEGDGGASVPDGAVGAARDGAPGEAGEPGAVDGSVDGGIVVSGTVADDPSSKILAGASVCLLDAPAVCTTSDAMGAFSLGGVAASGSGITASLAGYVDGVWPLTPTGGLGGFTIYLRTAANLQALASSVGASLGSSTGVIHFETLGGSGAVRAGVSVEATPSATVSYVTTPGKISTTATATSALGNGYVFGVPEGLVTLTFTAANSTCTRTGANGWPSQGTGTMTLPVKAGQVTRASTTCP